MRTSRVLLALLLAVAACAAGQEGAPSEAADAEVPSETPPAAPLLGIEEPQGDVVTLTTGAVLRNVQVIRRTPKEFEIQVVAEVSLKIPRRLVADVQYDDVEPSRRRARPPARKEADTLVGAKLKPEVHKKLTSAIPEPVLRYEDTDLVTILDDLSRRVGVTIELDDEIKARPRTRLIWDLESKPGATLMAILEGEMRQRFPRMVVVYEYDRIRIRLQPKAPAGES